MAIFVIVLVSLVVAAVLTHAARKSTPVAPPAPVETPPGASPGKQK